MSAKGRITSLNFSAEALIRTAAQQLERQAADLERAGRNLVAYVDSARERVRQDWRLAGVGVAGIVVGIAFTLFLPSILPFPADTHVAAFVMRRDRINAGYAMIESANPAKARNIEWARASSTNPMPGGSVLLRGSTTDWDGAGMHPEIDPERVILAIAIGAEGGAMEYSPRKHSARSVPRRRHGYPSEFFKVCSTADWQYNRSGAHYAWQSPQPS